MNIRTYCTTIAGSDRHKASKLMLDALGLPYEFVFAELVTDAPLRNCSKMQRWAARIDKHYPMSYVTASYSCKMTMARAMMKFYNDGGDWAFVIQDDVILDKNWLYKAEIIIKNAPEGTLALPVFRPESTGQIVKYYTTWCMNMTEPAMLVHRDYAKDNAEAMLTYPAESDWCYYMSHGSTPMVFPSVALAIQRPVPSTIDT